MEEVPCTPDFPSVTDCVQNRMTLIGMRSQVRLCSSNHIDERHCLRIAGGSQPHARH